VAASGHLEIDVRGAEQVERNALFLPLDARKAMRTEKRRLAKNLAGKLRRAVIAKTKVSRQTSPESRRGSRGSHLSHRPMGIRVRPTIKQVGDKVIAGPHPMLFGTEYGMNRKSGWYSRPEFANNPSLQYFRHHNEGYWFRPTVLASKPEMDAAVKRIVDDAVRHWG
jgi:hypothetical protein